MVKYFAKRLLYAAISLFVIVTVVFLLMRLMPVEGYFGNRSDAMNPEIKKSVLTKLGLLDPWYVQITNFYKKTFIEGDFGRSVVLRPKVKISKILAEKIPYSAAFGLGSIALSTIAGCALGVLMAHAKGKFWDKLGTGYILIINAVPSIVYYLFLQLYISSAFKVPMLFKVGVTSSYWLPLVCMSLGGIASNAMWTRRYMVDELNKDYLKLARAKGMKNGAIMVKHVARNAFIPMVQYLPSSILYTVSGSIYIEALFSIPGMGGLLVDAIQRQDNTLVQALVLIYSVIGVVGLLLGDVCMALLDPRIKLAAEGDRR